ncbi:Uncharacterised protein [Chromobacterium violaceum]|uniref:Uncharacterized protein n=1 Tax=Chromobacterium violaceum TaxID=536 RepID=A0A447THR5_CHRVL|nr:Uncharacterised protein [Chromobacterium violaceum]
MAQAAIAAILISMLAAPFLIMHGERITRRLIKQDWMLQSLDLHQMLVAGMSKDEHVLICGYGRSGQALAVCWRPRRSICSRWTWIRSG